MSSLVFQPHPILKAPTPQQIVALSKTPEGKSALIKWHQDYTGAIEAAERDPLRHGFNLESWDRIRWGLSEYDEVLILGGNRSSKTTGMGKLVMESVTELQNGHIVMFSQNEDTSIKVQQASIWEFMPKEFKKKTKGIEGYINYSMQNGFTAKSFIFPDTKTRVDFKTYSQFSNNQTILEGFEFGFPGVGDDPRNIGIVNDEYLGDSTLINTQRFRLATRNAKLLTGFTPIKGYTEFIADYLRGAETLETKPAALLNDEPLPVKQYSTTRQAAVVYLHTIENKFGGYERLAKDLTGRPRDEILCRAYGVPVKSITTLFPLFNTKVHVTDTLPKISKKTHTCYMVCDPAGRRSFCAIWAAVDAEGQVTILSEFPERGTYGEWAEFGEPKWKFGPAADKHIHSEQGYVDEFKEIEEGLGIEVFERIGDSRAFNTENDNSLTRFDIFSELGMDFVAADGRNEDLGLGMLDEWFHYNPNEEINTVNRPRVQIHKSCGNLIHSLINYGARGKVDEPLKDFIDLMRYLRLCNNGDGPEHYGPEAFNTEQPSDAGY